MMSTHHCQGLGRQWRGFTLGRVPAGARAQVVLLVAGPGKWGTPMNRGWQPWETPCMGAGSPCWDDAHRQPCMRDPTLAAV